MIDYLYIDIETIPAQDALIHAEIAETVSPPASMKKAETIAKWEAEQKPQAVKEAIEKTSFNGGLGHLACVSWALNDEDPWSLSVPELDMEKDIVKTLVDRISDYPNKPTIVGHFVTGFDIRFLWHRAMVLGVYAGGALPRDPKPWSNDVHDTMAMWAGARDTVSLDNLCKMLGVEGKEDVTGADVAQMWADRRHEEIAQYCMDDVRRVRSVHQKMLVAIGG